MPVRVTTNSVVWTAAALSQIEFAPLPYSEAEV